MLNSMLVNMPSREMVQLIAPIIILQLTLAAFCLFKLKGDKVKYLPKWAWALIVLFANLFGPVLYLVFGRERD